MKYFPFAALFGPSLVQDIQPIPPTVRLRYLHFTEAGYCLVHKASCLHAMEADNPHPPL